MALPPFKRCPGRRSKSKQKSLVSADKRGTQQTGRESELKNPEPEKQAQMMRAAIPDDANLGSKSVQSLLAEQIKFTLNAAVDI